ncbi:MAG TPA: endolytic transglycosylase MltG [Candidatus Bathyarchaeia archaeon]|nr:endolytic transglycosylase MltG [Candidatus Bathyarchaeia archaeon]
MLFKGLRRWIIPAFFLMSVLLGGFFWWQWANQPATKMPITTSEGQKIFVIKRGERIDEIAIRLKKDNLIRSPLAFKLLVLAKGLSKEIQAGDFRFHSGLNLEELVNQLMHGTLDIWVTLLEGWRSEQIVEELANKGFDIDIKNWQSKIANSALEGYLFPDTYLIPRDASQEAIIEILRDNFDKNIDERLRKKMVEKKLTLDQVLILASIVEREARLSEDRPIVAGILIKRWKNDWLLQADAAVQYAVADFRCRGRESGCDWWPKNLTKKDLGTESPYNTYKYKGLPPAPICNPSLESIEAVINWQDSSYWFYLSGSTGKIHYAQTIEDHNANIAKFLSD